MKEQELDGTRSQTRLSFLGRTLGQRTNTQLAIPSSFDTLRLFSHHCASLADVTTFKSFVALGAVATSNVLRSLDLPLLAATPPFRLFQCSARMFH